MTVFHADLDNTLIFSSRHDIGVEKRSVEIYEGREISFITNRTYELLKKVREKVLFVPTTTRTQKQYKRIDLGLGEPEYVLVCNGGMLLVNGQTDQNWYEESLSLISESRQELEKAAIFLEKEENRMLEVRDINQLFLFTKSSTPEETVGRLKEQLDTSLVDSFYNGTKVYVVPKKLSKGNAVARFKKIKAREKVIAAGDSLFDISMLCEADMPIAPVALRHNQLPAHTQYIQEGLVFSDALLSYILENLS